ncbi:hypothetical protein SAMN06265337_0642 [Hymenobacter gelipurpurascens]|uniref:Uncharacterized protein n=1 Tax=Hymenobacter gelipurpurascens TaxID=89968 RepID=A0A212T8F4_9BACT|nr:hypothetical protein SAMN06265337_0642 [Hymenobacter gelipurpurascens]
MRKKYVEESKVVKLVPAQFERMVENNSFAEFDKQTILHDPRPKAVAKAAAQPAEPGEPKQPAQPLASLPTLQDAQMRYQQLYNEVAPAVGYNELIDLIKAKDSTAGEEQEEEETDAA